MKATDHEIRAAYAEHGSVWKAGKALGMCGQSVHERLVKIGANHGHNVFTKEDDTKIMLRYARYRDEGRLQDLADEMGRDKTTLCGRAGKLGLTDPSCVRLNLRTWKGMSRSDARMWMDRFKESGQPLGEFCAKEGIGEVGFWMTMTRHFADEYDKAVEANWSSDTLYAVGREFEYATMEDLRTRGYSVMRAKRSKGPADVVGAKGGATLFIQCKNHGYMGVAEWNILFALSAKVGAAPILAYRGDDGKPVYMMMTARKDGTRRPQPWERYDP